MKQRHIDCIKRLLELLSGVELLDFMKEEKIISNEQLVELPLEVDKSKYIYRLLLSASSTEKIQLLAFDWILLPKEQIRIRIVTEFQTREFSYGY